MRRVNEGTQPLFVSIGPGDLTPGQRLSVYWSVGCSAVTQCLCLLALLLAAPSVPRLQIRPLRYSAVTLAPTRKVVYLPVIAPPDLSAESASVPGVRKLFWDVLSSPNLPEPARNTNMGVEANVNWPEPPFRVAALPPESRPHLTVETGQLWIPSYESDDKSKSRRVLVGTFTDQTGRG